MLFQAVLWLLNELWCCWGNRLQRPECSENFTGDELLDLAYVDLGIDPIAGLRIVDAHDFDALADAGKYPLMITQVYSQLVASDVKINLMEVLADEAQLYFYVI